MNIILIQAQVTTLSETLSTFFRLGSCESGVDGTLPNITGEAKSLSRPQLELPLVKRSAATCYV